MRAVCPYRFSYHNKLHWTLGKRVRKPFSLLIAPIHCTGKHPNLTLKKHENLKYDLIAHSYQYQDIHLYLSQAN